MRRATCVVAVLVTLSLTGCWPAVTPSRTYAPMPATCDELTQELREALFESSHVVDPEAEPSSGRETRLLHCLLNGEHPDLPTYVRSLHVTVTQVAQEVDTVSGTPVDDWLIEQADATRSHSRESERRCEVTDVEGAVYAVACVDVEHEVYVTTSLSAAAPDARVHVSVSVEMTRDQQDLTLSDLETATGEVARGVAGMVLPQLR